MTMTIGPKITLSGLFDTAPAADGAAVPAEGDFFMDLLAGLGGALTAQADEKSGPVGPGAAPASENLTIKTFQQLLDGNSDPTKPVELQGVGVLLQDDVSVSEEEVAAAMTLSMLPVAPPPAGVQGAAQEAAQVSGAAVAILAQAASPQAIALATTTTAVPGAGAKGTPRASFAVEAAPQGPTPEADQFLDLSAIDLIRPRVAAPAPRMPEIPGAVPPPATSAAPPVPATARAPSTPDVADIAAQPAPAPASALAGLLAPLLSPEPMPVEAAAAPEAPAELHDAMLEQQLDLAHEGEWLDRLARDIARSAGTEQSLRFRLNPEHLGSLHVELSQTQSGATLRLTADTEAARAIIADAQPRLVAEARAQGVRIAETHVDLGGGHNASGGQGRHADERQPAFVRTSSAGLSAEGEAAEPAARTAERYA